MTLPDVTNPVDGPDAPPADAFRDGPDPSTMPLLDHLIELRKRMLVSLAAFGLAFGVCFYFARPIFAVLVRPLVTAGQGRVIYTQLFEAFFVEIKVAMFAAFLIAFPIIATQLYRFIAPGLYRREKRAVLPFLLATPVLFAAGASAAYFGAIPVALSFLLKFQGTVGGIEQEALPSVGNYLSFVMHFIFAFGAAFLLPIVIMLIERAGIVTLDQLRGARRYVIAGVFIIAAVFTPPDVISQLLLAIPMILLYEAALIAIRITGRRTEPED